MASSNRHWPSMFKSKPCNRHEYSSPHFSAACKSLPLPSSGGGAEERSPEPKPRWNPKPEQIRILEAIFNSGMVNPPRDEIKKIRAQLQEYGQVGDANVFYWFQNRKSRSKQKSRQLLHSAAKSTAVTSKAPPGVHVAPPSSTSSSSSDRSSPKNVLELSNSPTGPVGRTFFHHHGDSFLHQEIPAPTPLPYFFPVQQNGAFGGCQAGFSFNEIISGGGGRTSACSSQVVHPLVEPATTGTFSGLLLGEMIGGGVGGDELKRSSTLEDEEKLRLEQELSFLVTNPSSTNTIVPPTSAASLMFPSLSDAQGAGESGMVGPPPAKSSTVFINEVAFEVPADAPFNVREVFGDDAMLVHQTGHPVATTEWGLTAHPLQHGAFYFLARTLASPGPAAFEKHDAAPYLLPPPEFPFNYKI